MNNSPPGAENNEEVKQKESSQGVTAAQKKQTSIREPRDSDDEFSGDDILGLIDTPQKPTVAKKTSRFDELLGRKQPQEDKQQLKKEEQFSNDYHTIHNISTSNTENTAGVVLTNKDDESSKNTSSDFQFGGYLPSSISSSGNSRKSRGLPQGRRKGLSDVVASERPNTAPGKKSVRFSDTVNSSNDVLRPSSTPAVKGHMKQEEINSKVDHQSDKDVTANLRDTQAETKISTTSVEKSQSDQLLTETTR